MPVVRCTGSEFLSANWTFSLEILGQFVTRMHQFIGQSDVKHIMTSLIKTITLVLKTDIITNIPGLA
jgi:hypothetical protein